MIISFQKPTDMKPKKMVSMQPITKECKHEDVEHIVPVRDDALEQRRKSIAALLNGARHKLVVGEDGMSTQFILSNCNNGRMYLYRLNFFKCKLIK